VASVNIGEILKKARLQKNMSLDELQQITKVQKRYLIAIENNEFESMPGTFYVRAFIRQYASAVGLNGAELVDIFDGKDPKPVVEEPKPVYEELDKSRTRLHEEEKHSSWLVRNLPAIAFSLIGLAIAVVVLYIMWQDKKSDPIIQQPVASSTASFESESTEVPSSESSSSSSSEATSSSTSSSSSEEKKASVVVTSDADMAVSATVSNANSPLKVSLTGKNGPCWVGIMVNGAYTYQYTLQAGETQTTELPAGATNATLVLGASNNVNVQLDGQPLTLQPTQVLIRKDVTLAITYKQ
jgi:cytoskeletal protein RodZ